ncbi:acyl-CoA synthetase FdrA [Brassicibacter mesophilus]|uniref:acyl-CoA synthetase FdrA n=1 Tax=Brassicibacter mesophilus TaxID=745119 RepID=UPI003D1C490D
MIYGLIKKNTYQDSVNLMVLSSKLSNLEGINKVSIMMGTPANKEIFQNTGMYASEFEDASPNDICIAVDTENSDLVKLVSDELGNFIKEQSSKSSASKLSVSRTLEGALNSLPDANLALISLPGEYVYKEVDRLLDKDMNAFIFSDNVSIEDEKKLKQKAHDKGLLVMGPDCGTGIISNLPLAFANVIPKGNIGIVGASGTGIQEVTSIIGRNGGGISHAIGIGGRDLSEEVGAISAIDALNMLNKDENTDVIVFISKPPAPSVKSKVIEVIRTLDKKVVALFLGEKSEVKEDNISYAWTLEEAAYQALMVSKSFKRYGKNIEGLTEKLNVIKNNPRQRKIHGFFGGGTLAGEAAMLLKDFFNIKDDKHTEGFMLIFEDHLIIDFGDDMYTKGRPHPMIDPRTRIEAINKLDEQDEVAVVLFDNVLGYGSNDDMAGALVPAIKKVSKLKKSKGQEIIFIASICGTEEDFQVYSSQVEKLKDAGVIVLDTNAEATFTAIEILKYLNSKDECKVSKESNDTLLNSELKIINIGLESFANTILKHNGQVVQYNWAPIAGGDKKTQSLLDKLNSL